MASAPRTPTRSPERERARETVSVSNDLGAKNSNKIPQHKGLSDKGKGKGSSDKGKGSSDKGKGEDGWDNWKC